MPDDTKPDEPQYTDPETGKPIIYADNVPELLRGLNAGDLGFDLSSNSYDEFWKNPLACAQKGKEFWGECLQFAELKKGCWLEREETSDSILIRLREPQGNPRDRNFFKENGIDFSEGRGMDHNRRYTVGVLDFSEFLFPCPVSFKGAEWGGIASFEKVMFTGLVSFEDAILRRGADFTLARFHEDADFRRCAFPRGADFSNVNFGADAFFEGNGFGYDVKFENTIFSGRAIFKTEFRNVDFSKAVFGKDIILRSPQVNGRAAFLEARFCQIARFSGTQFNSDVLFDGAKFDENAHLNGCAFAGSFRCVGARFLGDSNWEHCKFNDVADYTGTAFEGEASFRHAHFKAYANFHQTKFSRSMV